MWKPETMLLVIVSLVELALVVGILVVVEVDAGSFETLITLAMIGYGLAILGVGVVGVVSRLARWVSKRRATSSVVDFRPG